MRLHFVSSYLSLTVLLLLCTHIPPSLKKSPPRIKKKSPPALKWRHLPPLPPWLDAPAKFLFNGEPIAVLRFISSLIIGQCRDPSLVIGQCIDVSSLVICQCRDVPSLVIGQCIDVSSLVIGQCRYVSSLVIGECIDVSIASSLDASVYS